MENVFDTEYELIRALPKEGMALVNTYNKITKLFFEKIRHKKYSYSSSAKNKCEIFADQIKPSESGCTARVHFKRKTIVIKTHLLGRHVVENLLPAIYLADYFGMSKDEVIDQAVKIVSPDSTMTRKKSKNGSWWIDDTFNISPESVLAAIDYLSLCNGKKFLVMSQLIELGNQAPERYSQIGIAASKKVDTLYLINDFCLEYLQKAIFSSKGSCKLFVGSAREIAEDLRKNSGKKSTIVFEGKESKMVQKLLV
jgi:UDP-N-acetylmuramoyl-tripeptide--D-alanyl-D-alanine ligase